jgi:enamine deaminase RidA (YjgF/YER057c/UK114 family)
MTVEDNLRLLQLTLPETPRPLGDYVLALEAGNLLFVSGMLPIKNGAAAFVGRVGQELTIESGRKATQLAVVNALAVARDAVGLNRLAGVARLGVHVVCAPDFQQHATIADTASELLNQVFGASRLAARPSAIHHCQAAMPVELELIFLLPKERSVTP